MSANSTPLTAVIRQILEAGHHPVTRFLIGKLMHVDHGRIVGIVGAAILGDPETERRDRPVELRDHRIDFADLAGLQAGCGDEVFRCFDRHGRPRGRFALRKTQLRRNRRKFPARHRAHTGFDVTSASSRRTPGSIGSVAAHRSSAACIGDQEWRAAEKQLDHGPIAGTPAVNFNIGRPPGCMPGAVRSWYAGRYEGPKPSPREFAARGGAWCARGSSPA